MFEEKIKKNLNLLLLFMFTMLGYVLFGPELVSICLLFYLCFVK